MSSQIQAKDLFRRLKILTLFAAILISTFSTPDFCEAESSKPEARSTIASFAATQAQTRTVYYSPTTELFANPERGFYRYFESRASEPTQWTLEDFTDIDRLSWMNDDEEATIRQAYCLFYLDDFLESDISPAFLEHIRANLRNVRKAGMKCILRFAYTCKSKDNNANDIPDILEDPNVHTEPRIEQLLSHIDQLRPILTTFSDVITVLQAGFIGIWGEWYYTDHFVDDPKDPDTVSANQFARRKRVIDKLLGALPKTRQIALRTPLLKKRMYGRDTPIRAFEAFTNTAVGRLAFHNDAFLNSFEDSGTFESGEDKNYLASETLYLSMGGEINEPGSGTVPPRSCSASLRAMSKYHWSYINADYFEEALTNWKKEGCIHDPGNISGSIMDRLGYRLVLKQATFPVSVTTNRSFDISIALANQGFAAPYNRRRIHLVFFDRSFSSIAKIPLSVDVRRWLAGQTFTFTRSISLPSTIRSGEYRLALELSDLAPSLQRLSKYSIRLANKGLWMGHFGWNNLLHTVRVTE